MKKVILLAGVAAAVAVAVLSSRPLAQTFTTAAGTVPAPDPNIPLYFEAASVKPSNSSNPGQGIRRQPGGRFNTINTPVRTLITFAYQIQNFQLVGGPDWIGNDRYDIVAKMEGDPPAIVPGSGADHMMLATRSLLADRFKLVVHREKRELDIYALTMAKPGGKPGPALKPASGDCSPAAFAARAGGPLQPPVGRRLSSAESKWDPAGSGSEDSRSIPMRRTCSPRSRSNWVSSSNPRKARWRCWSSTAYSTRRQTRAALQTTENTEDTED